MTLARETTDPVRLEPAHDADTVLAALASRRVVPVIVLDDAAAADPLGAALVRGGLPVAEITLRTPAALDAIRVMSARGDMLVGAGTVLTAEQVDQAVDAGARFVVSPGLDQNVVRRCVARGVLALPGVVTPGEIMAALNLGLTTVKFFPAGPMGGARAVAALAAPFAGVRFVPTGGIDKTSAADYLRLPCVAAVGGSWMVPRDLLAAGDFTAVGDLCADAVILAGGSTTSGQAK